MQLFQAGEIQFETAYANTPKKGFGRNGRAAQIGLRESFSERSSFSVAVSKREGTDKK
jgi:hypothetical protein